MNHKLFLLIGFVVLVGLFGSLGLYVSLCRNAVLTSPVVDVVIAAGDLHAGRTIEDEDVKIAKFQSTDLPPNCFREKSMVIGRGVMVPMAKGDFVQLS